MTILPPPKPEKIIYTTVEARYLVRSMEGARQIWAEYRPMEEKR